MDVVKHEERDTESYYVVTDPKYKNNKFYIRKAKGGFSFFEIGVSRGRVASEISGWFTKPEKALKALEDWLKVQKDGMATRRDKMYERAHGTTVQSDDKKHVQQGPAD